MRTSLIALFFACLAACASAQWEVNGPNAALLINGQVASSVDPIGHDIDHRSGTLLSLRVDTGTNLGVGVAVVLSPVDPSGLTTVNYPGIGRFNVGLPATPLPQNVVLLGDGIGNSVNPLIDSLLVSSQSFLTGANVVELSFSTSSASVGLHAAVQCLVADPSAGPFLLDLSECADVNIHPGQSLTVLTGNSGTAFVPFVSGASFPFHGQVYTGVWVHADGFVTFGGPSTIPPYFGSVSTVEFVGREPAIAACYADWPIASGGPQDGVYYEESVRRVKITWGDPRGLPSGRAGIYRSTNLAFPNRFSLELFLDQNQVVKHELAGAFKLDYPLLLNQTSGGNVLFDDGVLGQTPGGSLGLASAYDLDLQTPQTSLGLTMVEEHAYPTALLPIIGYDGLGSPRALVNMRSWAGRSLTFRPLPAPIGGAAGYSSTPEGVPADYVFPSAVVATIGPGGTPGTPISVTLAGKFFGFDAPGLLGSVSASVNGFPLVTSVTGVLDGTFSLPRSLPNSPMGPYRNGEGLVIQLNAATLPDYVPVRLNLSFASGYVAQVLMTRATQSFSVFHYLSPGTSVIASPGVLQQQAPVSLFNMSTQILRIHADGLVQFCPISSTPVVPSPSVTLTNLFTSFSLLPQITVASAWTPSLASPVMPFPSVGPGIIPVIVNSDVISGTVSITWFANAWAATGNPMGVHTVRISTNQVIIDHSMLIPDVGNTSTVVTGVSDQGPGQNVAIVGPGYVSSQPGESLGSATTATNGSVILSLFPGGIGNFLDGSGMGQWTVF